VAPFEVSGTTLEWQGEKIFRNHVTRIIPFFAGLRRLNQLSIYPVTPKLREELTERGRRYMTYIGEPKYVSYKGALVQRVGRDIIKTRAEGRCVADMANYRRLNPGNDLWDGDDEYDESSDLGELPKSGEKVDTTAIPEEDLCLTPPTIFGFSLVLKEWGELDYEQFSPIEFDDKAWDHLELDPHYKSGSCCVEGTAVKPFAQSSSEPWSKPLARKTRPRGWSRTSSGARVKALLPCSTGGPAPARRSQANRLPSFSSARCTPSAPASWA
jgi:hypothetical protein